MGTGEHLVVDGLGGWQWFTGDRGLVDVAGAVHDSSVCSDSLAGSDDDDVADRHIGCVNLFFGSGGGHAGGLCRGQIEQALHRILCPACCDGFQGSGGGEDDDQQAAVEYLSDRGRSDRGDDHQQVDVEGLLAQRLQSCPGRFPASSDIAGQVQAPVHPDRCSCELGNQSCREQHGGGDRPSDLG